VVVSAKRTSSLEIKTRTNGRKMGEEENRRYIKQQRRGSKEKSRRGEVLKRGTSRKVSNRSAPNREDGKKHIEGTKRRYTRAMGKKTCEKCSNTAKKASVFQSGRAKTKRNKGEKGGYRSLDREKARRPEEGEVETFQGESSWEKTKSGP